MNSAETPTGIEVFVATIAGGGGMLAVAGLVVFQFAFTTEMIRWGLVLMAIGAVILLPTVCVLAWIKWSRSRSQSE